MNIFSSFVDWLEGIGTYLQSLYKSNPDAFMIAVVALVVILLIIIIALAKAKNRADGEKTIKYEDIDFSTEAERKAAQAVPATEPRQNVSRGLPEKVTEEELKPKYGAFDVPNWMTKQTMSIDEANMIDADQWVGEQLGGTPAQDGDSISGAEFAAAAATGVIMSGEPGETLKEVTVKIPSREEPGQPVSEPAEPEPEQPVIHLNESNLSELVEEPVREETVRTEPVVRLNEPNISERPDEPQKPSFDTGTLAKIMKEQEELSGEDPGADIRKALGESREEESFGTVMSDAIRDEKPGIISMRTLGEDPSSAEVSREYNELLEGNIDFAGKGFPGLRDQAGDDYDERGRSSGASAPRTVGRIHYGSHNRDTNRSGVKFTEEELMEKIRD